MGERIDGQAYGSSYGGPQVYDQWSTLTVEVDSATGMLTGKLIHAGGVFEFTHVLSTPYRSGLSGVYSGNAHGYFDDFRVTSQDIHPVPNENLLVNGSFEMATLDQGQFFTELTAGSTTIFGWVVSQGQIDYYASYPLWFASEGSRSIDLEGGQFPGDLVGGIQQTFATIPGQRYKVKFDMAGNTDGGPAIKTLRVLAAGQHQDFSFDTTGQPTFLWTWATHEWFFTATGTQTTLNFVDVTSGGQGFGPTLDNVSVVPVPGPLNVPIDIRPWSPVNLIVRQSPLSVPVAILSSATLNAPAQVDQGSLTFGRIGDEPSLHICESRSVDVDRDGYKDLVCLFHIRTAAFQKGDTEGIMKGKTVSDVPFVGSDSVRILGW